MGCKLAIAVLTYNRLDMFRRTVNSLESAADLYPVVVVDNGSTDGTAQLVKIYNGFCNETDDHSTGYGMNLAIAKALEHDPEYVLFTADDYVYDDDWHEKLLLFWESASPKIKLASCHLEPVYGWNTITGGGHIRGVPYITRLTLPGSNWTFRAADWPLIGPIPHQTGGEDHIICNRLIKDGYELAALDLAAHIGEKHSAWGNKSWESAQPLDRPAYGFIERVDDAI